jgi:hypothetical protein
MTKHDPVYDEDDRKRRLMELLRALAARIQELDAGGGLLGAGPEVLKLMGDARSELFHYEVRCTYDSPEQAESRRIVEQARQQMEELGLGDEDPDLDDEEDGEPWRSR